MKLKNWKIIIAFLTIALVLGLMRWFFPERSLEETGWRALLDAFFAISLTGFVIIVSMGLGLKLLSWLNVDDFDSLLEQIVFAAASGMGILAYGVLTLGLLGFLNVYSILFWLLLTAIFSAREWSSLIAGISKKISRKLYYRLSFGPAAFMIIGAFIFLLCTLQALTPLWDYDGLMYHLQAPKIFLESGRIQLLPDLWQANGPLTMEMLYTLGVAFGSVSFAKLLHLAFALGLVLITYSLGRHTLGGEGGYVAAGILLGIPIFSFWGSLAYADMAWALYEVLAFAAVFRWRETGKRSWLTLAGLAMGWGLGSKYLALGMFGILALWIAFHSRSRGFKVSLSNTLHYGLIATVIGAPWYLKNWIWAGNPFYPFIFGGTDWSGLRLDLLMTYLRSFGTGKSFLDYLLLPLNLYAQRDAFGTFMMTIDLPSLLFPFILFLPFVSKASYVKPFAIITLLRFIVWSLGSQQTRFLLPLYPILSVLAAGSLYALGNRFKRALSRSMLTYGIVGGVMVSSLIYQLIFFPSLLPHRVVLGRESKAAFLERARYDFAAHLYINEMTFPETRVFQMWDGQAYYCEDRCIVDAEQAQWVRLTLSYPSLEEQVTALQDMYVTHFLLDLEGLNFMLNHDPSGRHLEAFEYFFNIFQKQCAQEMREWPDAVLYEFTCR
jgi:4-amino-4-deoxy-L-arabinose transferase-like glycosyltransferase